jgi:phage/plasmid-like protein (TIGR03299 family)
MSITTIDPAPTRPVDVNERFAAQRADALRVAADRQRSFEERIADGRLVPLGDGRYRVNDPGSWDNGEVWTRANGVVLPQHGLDETTGRAALYSRVPGWHEVGTVIPGGTASIEKVLEAAAIGYEVVRRPVLFQTEPGGAPHVLADQFVTVRQDTGAGLGVVGARYEVLQNRHAFEFLQDLIDDYEVVWESAGALREGRRVFVSMRLPGTVTVDAPGINDEIVPFLAAINSHDGSSLFQVVVTPWRPVCGNTERFAVRDAHSRWGVRHTANARERIEEARRTLGLSVRYYQRFAADQEALARTDCAIADFDALVEHLWPAPEAEAPARTRHGHERRRDVLRELWRANTKALGATAYAAERVITEYADWRTTIRPTGSLRGRDLAARATAVLEGGNDELKTRAHRRLMTLATR